MTDFAARRTAFRKLHEGACFVMPNPWDVGSARYLQRLQFPALATTSAGFAFSQGLPDHPAALSRSRVLAHLAEIVSAVDVPVHADFQSGYADAPEGVEESVRLCVEAGVAGLSIEDATGNGEKPLFDLPEAVQRLRAARAVIDAGGGDVLLTARAECFLVGHPDPLNESIRRVEAYAAAGADVLFVPGLREREEISAVLAAVRPKPVNVLISAPLGLGVADLEELGVRRISVGSALARAAWAGLIRAAGPIAQEGSFAGLEGATPFAELNSMFQEDSGLREPR